MGMGKHFQTKCVRIETTQKFIVGKVPGFSYIGKLLIQVALDLPWRSDSMSDVRCNNNQTDQL